MVQACDPSTPGATAQGPVTQSRRSDTVQRHGDGRLLGDDNYGHTGDAWNPSAGSVQPDHRAGHGVVVTETIVDRSTSTGQRKIAAAN